MQVDVLTAVDTFYQTAPVQAAFVTCGLKASLSDTISQKTVEKVCAVTGEVTEHRFCFSRNAAFVLYGGLYQGVTQHFIFNEIYPVIFGVGTDLATVASKVAFDQLVLTPFLCLPVAYVVKSLVFRYPIQEALAKYVADARKDLLLKYWAIWTPTQCLTFSVIPEHLRIPFIALVSFFWWDATPCTPAAGLARIHTSSPLLTLSWTSSPLLTLSWTSSPLLTLSWTSSPLLTACSRMCRPPRVSRASAHRTAGSSSSRTSPRGQRRAARSPPPPKARPSSASTTSASSPAR